MRFVRNNPESCTWPEESGFRISMIQQGRPETDANWLPAPQGAFNLTMRFSGPETAVLDGKYRLPAGKKMK